VVEEIKHGATLEEAAERYGVSLGSVVRFLRAGPRNRECQSGKVRWVQEVCLGSAGGTGQAIGGAAAGYYAGGAAAQVSKGGDKSQAIFDFPISSSCEDDL
jgi:hypothetical protein